MIRDIKHDIMNQVMIARGNVDLIKASMSGQTSKPLTPEELQTRLDKISKSLLKVEEKVVLMAIEAEKGLASAEKKDAA